MKEILLLITLLMLPTPASADLPVAAALPVTIVSSWAEPTTTNPLSSRIYIYVQNNGPSPLTLHAFSSPAGTVSLYKSMQADPAQPPQPLDHVTIAPRATVLFAPESNEVILGNLKAPLKLGDTIKLTLNFDSGDTTIDVPVANGGAGGACLESGDRLKSSKGPICRTNPPK